MKFSKINISYGNNNSENVHFTGLPMATTFFFGAYNYSQKMFKVIDFSWNFPRSMCQWLSAANKIKKMVLKY